MVKKGDLIQCRIEKIKISGFRSLQEVEVPMTNLSVVIGANGSGKSNFIKFFEFVNFIAEGNCGRYIALNGGADDQLFGGNKKTPRLSSEIHFTTYKGRNDYRFALAHASDNRFIFVEESFRFNRANKPESKWISTGALSTESRLREHAASGASQPAWLRHNAKITIDFLRNCRVFQFHDTSRSAAIKQPADVTDTAMLRPDACNLAAVLRWLEVQQPVIYRQICDQIARILPGFAGFELQEQARKVALRWRSDFFPEKTFGAHLTSDGSLRLFALVTLLNLPHEMLPDIILLDEPELGLHPTAITLIAAMIRRVASEKQVILATQSPLLVDCFALEHIIVANYDNGQTILRALRTEDYTAWIDSDFSPGQMWLSNLFGGRP